MARADRSSSPRTPRRRRRVPSLVSRQCGNMTIFVVDRSGQRENSPESRTAASPSTPAHDKPPPPSRCQRVVLKPAEEVAKELAPCAVVKAETAADTSADKEEEAGSATEISSASPCSSAEDSSTDESEDEGEGTRPASGAMPYYGFVPVMPAMLPPTFRRGHWRFCHQWQMDNLVTWYQNARQRAELRGAPKADEPCVVGCCCRRCIGYPAAFRPPGLERTSAEDKEAAESDREGTQAEGGDTSSESTDSDSSDDVEVVFPTPVPSTWVSPTLSRWDASRKEQPAERQVFCANLDASEASAADLQQAFEQRFRALPAYQERYMCQGMAFSAVQRVALRGKHGRFAFVTFLDEYLASTAMLFHGMEFCGRKMRIGRPTDYAAPPDGSAPPLDVSLLRRIGMLPREEEKDAAKTFPGPPPPQSLRAPPPPGLRHADAQLAADGSKCKAAPPVPPLSIQSMKHLYLGNLPVGEDTLQDVSEMITCIGGGLPAYDPQLGPAMLDAKEVPTGGWLVEMQSAALARQAQDHLRTAIFKGRSITVYVTFGHVAPAHGGA